MCIDVERESKSYYWSLFMNVFVRLVDEKNEELTLKRQPHSILCRRSEQRSVFAKMQNQLSDIKS